MPKINEHTFQFPGADAGIYFIAISLLGGIALLLVLWPMHEGLVCLVFVKFIGMVFLVNGLFSLLVTVKEVMIEPTGISFLHYFGRVNKIPNEAISEIKINESSKLTYTFPAWIHINPLRKDLVLWIYRIHLLPFGSYLYDILPLKQDLISFYGDKVVVVDWGKKKIF